jgi:soluble lytic murein transglycosylase
MRYCIFIFTVAFSILFASNSFADIYKHVDKNGVIYFTNIPKGKGYKKIISGKNSKSSGWNQIVRDKSIKYSIEPSIIKALITVESNWDPEAVSNKGAIGLMQLMPSTANDMNIKNSFDPGENIEGGTRYLRYLLDRFNGNLDLALAAYNAGPETVQKHGGIPSITETIKFVESVISIHKKESAGKPYKIYKVTFKDGSTLYTNTPPPSKREKL